MPLGSYLESAYYLTGLRSARFSWGGREYVGEPDLDNERAVTLTSLELEPESYGRELYDAVFPPGSELREGLREAVLAAEREQGRLRFLLHLAPDLPEWVHALFWELLLDQGRHLALSRSPDTAFSRYLSVRREPGAPATRRPRLLCAIAAPSDLGRFGLAEICREEVVRRLEAPLNLLAEAVEVEILEPPVTLERLRQRLMTDGGFHLLHFFGHGQSRGGASALVLEDDQGRAKFVGEDLLAELFLGVRELRLVTLIACHGGAPSSHDPFSGLAGRLVQRGLPAVIAMRRAVSVESAHLFTDHLYRHIAQTGRADAAVNEARQQLYLAEPRGIAWSTPVLYSRLIDGRLWLSQDEAPEGAEVVPAAPLLQVSWRRLRNPAAWLPALLALLLVALGLLPASEAEARLDLRVSRLSFQLAESATVVEQLDLEELAATQLAALRLPSVLPAPAEWGNGRENGKKGFFLAASNPGARITLNARTLPAGSRVSLEHQGGLAYRLSFAGSSEEMRATFQGAVALKPLQGALAKLQLDHPESLELVPLNGAVELDLTVSRLAPDALSREIPIDRLSLHQVVERHSPEASMVREESTILGGEARVLANGEGHRLKEGEWLRFSAIAGTLKGLRLGQDGIRLGFQGRVSDLERASGGLQPEPLMPSVLDLWIPGPAQRPVQGSAGGLAVVILLFAVLEVRPRSSRLRKASDSILPSTPIAKEV